MIDNQERVLLDRLHLGKITIEGQFAWGSNYTFLTDVSGVGESASLSIKAVYKPTKGENPLWDFPDETLAHREAAAYLVSEALQWRLVPPTVFREEVPLGPGSLQLFVNHDPDYHYFNFTTEDKNRLRKVVLFDLLINNADRKGGHILIDQENQLWCIDHGICFHKEDKHRTVIWDFAGEVIPEEYCRAIGMFSKLLETKTIFSGEIKKHLDEDEIIALSKRAFWISELIKFPYPASDRYSFPWPPL